MMCFFFNDTATTEIYTLSLHDALPICTPLLSSVVSSAARRMADRKSAVAADIFLSVSLGITSSYGGNWPSTRLLVSVADRKSTRLNSSHANISYAVFCLKNKKKMTHSW